MKWPRAFLSIPCAVVLSAFAARAATPVNPRISNNTSAGRVTSNDVVSRRATGNVRARSGTVTRSGLGTGRAAINTAATRSVVNAGNARSATANRIARTNGVAVNARTGRALGTTLGGYARSASVARATAIFNDVSKIGSGYANCRESYSTCMDQLCANANDTYRRCFCSDRFITFRNTEDALDRAMIMLQTFQDNNLEAVDKTAAEVNAMYSATVGEAAIKKDTSASAKLLQNITDLLSGKSNTSKSSSNTNSLGILSFDFNTDMDDIWSGEENSLFSSMGQDISSLEGADLFNAAQKQCVRLAQSSCENNAVFSMARSSYNILVTQDCNTYEKTLNKKRETVAQAVRMAEKYLREARLEEYRSHNSADVNACIAAVRSAILADTACGEGYKRCLDPTGAYINGSTGAPIYSPRLLKLEDTIKLDGISTDILGQNQNFDKFLDGYRKYVTRELDTCRDIADFVWTEFKRNAIIEIAQAQTEKIEEVKASCVDTMAECYDSTSSTLINMNKNTATTAGALGRYASRDMCREKVIACANLYNTSSKTCTFDSRGHLEGGATEEYNCGLASLLNYVDAVDTLNVVEKCADAIEEYLANLCTPDDGKHSYPYNCKGMNPIYSESDNMSLPYVIERFANNNCSDSTGALGKSEYADVQDEIDVRVDSITRDVLSGVRAALGKECESLGGLWYNNNNPEEYEKSEATRYDFILDSTKQQIATSGYEKFYNQVSGRGVTDSDLRKWGACIESDARTACLKFADDDWATWDASTETCIFEDEWYEDRCEIFLGGVWDNTGGYCYVSTTN